jgi:hypothetical protein
VGLVRPSATILHNGQLCFGQARPAVAGAGDGGAARRFLTPRLRRPARTRAVSRWAPASIGALYRVVAR